MGYDGVTEHVPSPAKFVAEALLTEIRDADFAVRFDEQRYVVLVTESDAKGAKELTERIRTRMGSEPFLHLVNGTGVYARAWAGCAAWSREITTPEAYVRAAIEAMNTSRPGYETEQAWFKGVGNF